MAALEATQQQARDTAARRRTARISPTDPEARVMKMADGGFRPAFNAQMAADTGSQIIVGVDVGNVGSDLGQLPPMVEQLGRRYGREPAEMLVDGGFAGHDAITELAARGCTVYAPVPQPKDLARDPHQPREADSAAVAQWRYRMGTDATKTLYKLRAATAECINAIARNRGLQQFRVRSLRKVKAVLLWFALAHNLMRAVELRLTAPAGT